MTGRSRQLVWTTLFRSRRCHECFFFEKVVRARSTYRSTDSYTSVSREGEKTSILVPRFIVRGHPAGAIALRGAR